MRLSLIISVLALTALLFFSAVRSFPAADSANAAMDDAAAQIEANRVELDQQIAALNQEMATLRVSNTDQATVLAAALAERDQLQAQLAQTNERLSVVVAENNTLAVDNEDLAQELATLIAGQGDSEGTAGELQATIEALNIEIAQGRDTAQTLQARITELESEKGELTQQIAELESNAASPGETADGDIAQAQALLEQSAAELAAAQERIALLTEMATVQMQTEQNLTDEIDALAVQVTTLADETSTLSDEVAKRDAVIAGLMARPETATASPEAGCQERTDAILAQAQVSFENGTTTLVASSMPLLKEFAVIASDCAQNNLTLEIEGHTESTGGIASNLLLSDGRAKAVRDALIENGVPAPAMRAVGFGGSEPIADSETSEGQFQNQRIVFDWEQS